MSLANILTITQPLVSAIEKHQVFSAINSLKRLRRFAELHVFAVYDFMVIVTFVVAKPEGAALPVLNSNGKVTTQHIAGSSTNGQMA